MSIRAATPDDQQAVADLAATLAQSFPFQRDAFDRAYPALIADPGASVLVAGTGGGIVGYLLGFRHETFFASGPVALVEEILVREGVRGTGIGRALMTSFETWAHDHGCVQVSLATRRAADFYRALGYEESARHFRTVFG